jgi:tetratricopeptide (TPR) repeat protein
VLEGLAAKHPERHDTHAMLGELLEEKGDFEGALQAFRSSLLLDPNQPLNHLRVSDLLLQIGQPEEAVAQLRIARERFPDLPQVTYSLAVALGRANRHGEALAMFEAAISEARRSNPQLLNGAFFFAYGAAAERADQLDLAAQLLQKSVELDPQNAAQSLNYLGYTWVDRNMRLDEARKLIDKALGLDPENPAFLDSLGWYHYRAGHFDEALPILLRAAERIEPEDAVIFEHIGDTYAALKQTAEAIAYWKKSATLDPKNTAVAEKLRKAEAGSTGGTAAPEKNR